MTPSVRYGIPPIAGRQVRPRGRRLLLLAMVLGAVLAAGCRKAPEDWLDLLLHGDDFERRMAVTALRKVENDKVRPAMRALLAAMQDRNADVARAALDSLVVLAHRDIEGFLATIRQVHPQGQRWRDDCVRALGTLDAPATPRLFEVLCDPTDSVRELLAEAVRHQGPEAVEGALQALAQAGVTPPAALTE